MAAARIDEALRHHAASRPDALAVADGDAALDWAAAAEHVDALAAALRRDGVRAGDRVALIAPDGIAAWCAVLAVLAAGGVHCPLDHALARPEQAAALAAIEATWVLEIAWRDGHPQPRLAASGRPRPAEPPVGSPGAVIRATSGTTGAAKGVLLSHATVLARSAAAAPGLGFGPGDRVLWLLPMAYHVAVSVLHYVQVGAGLVFGVRLRAADTAALARRWAATAAYASPYHVRRLAELPAGHDLPGGMRRIIATTTALDAGAAAALHARHGLPVAQALGIIEVGLPFVSPGGRDEAVGALGRPLPAYDAAILGERGEPLAAGTPGELAIGGPGLFDAYLAPWRPRAAALHDGRFRTGDLAARDADGGIRLLGRRKDLINVGGMKVFPIEVESVLAAHPAVAAVRVRAAPDPRTGECVRAEIALHPGGDPAAVQRDLEERCAERLGALRRPAQWAFVDRLPLTGSGKVRRD